MAPTLSFPPRLDANGELVTIDDTSGRAAAELAAGVLSTVRGERPLAPGYGVDDPLAAAITAGAIAAAIALSEPELALNDVTITDGTRPAMVNVRVDVDWS